MSLKTAIASRFVNHLVSESSLMKARARAERVRQASHQSHRIEYFHQADDPYSHLLVQVLPQIAERYDVEIVPHLVGPPPEWAAPEHERLVEYSRRDAARLARRAGLEFEDPGSQPDPALVESAERNLAAAIAGGTFLSQAAELSRAVWTESRPAMSAETGTDPAPSKAEGAARREQLGHYLGGTLYYAGEWYWGIDRLHYLEERLAELGACRGDRPAEPIYTQPRVPACAAQETVGAQPDLHFYLSFRSPYTYIATQRVHDLTNAYGARLRLRYVLPMVMRGLPVRRMKAMYIVRDVAREARRGGVPFGRVADPVGKPVERGYSILPWAIDQGRGFEYCLSFMRAVWSEGVDAGSDHGLQRIVEAAGLDWRRARELVGDTAWQTVAEANRVELLDLGLWGVPSFRIGSVTAWGQDRLWVIEDELQRLSGTGA
jgi:2-hydroxychromene-2-carboxylate isomerase